MHHRLGLALTFSTSLLSACAQQDADATSTEYIIVLLTAEETEAEPTFELTTDDTAAPERTLGRVQVVGEDEPTLTVTLEGVDAELVVIVEDGQRALWWDDEALEPEATPLDADQRLALQAADQALDELGVVELSFRCWPKKWK